MNMRKRSKSGRFGQQYIRYLISYMTILLIPLVILTFFYSRSFLRKFYEEIYETVDLELVQTATQLENELETMQNTVVQLTLNGALPNTSTVEVPFDYAPVISALSGFCATNSFVEDMILVLDGKEYLATSTTTCRTDYYFDRIFGISAAQKAVIQDQLIGSQIPSFLPLKRLSGEEIVLFSYPIFTDYQKYEGNALFAVKTATIKQLISQKLQSYQSQIYITDPQGQMIVSTGPTDSLPERIPGPMNNLHVSVIRPAVTHQAAADTSAADENFLIRSFQSDNNDWHYLACIPDQQKTFSQVNALMWDFLVAIIVILLLASFTIYVLQKVNYAPMRRLRDKAKEITPEKGFTNEFETIDHALDYLATQNTSLATRLAGSLTAVLNERLYRLLSGSYASREDFNLDCSELEISLPYPYFVSAIILVHASEIPVEILAQEIKEQFELPHVYYYLHNFTPNQIVFLLNLSEQVSRPYKRFQKVQDYMEKTHGCMTTIGIGSCVDNTEAIAQSYMEAGSALDYRFVKGSGTIIDIKEVLDPARVRVFYPHQEFEALRNALLSQNEQSIRSAIQNIIQFMEQNQLPLYLARSICFNLIHMVNEHCRGRRQSVSNSPLELSGMETAQEITRMLHTWSNSLDELTAPAAKKAGIREVLHYLDDHCLNCDFSAFEAAEHFGMTLPGFSKFFKDSTGQNVMDYTINLRVEAAKKLLKTTELPLKEIAEQVGYYNLSSFTRRFKLHQGITPSEFRRISMKSS